MKNIDPSLKGGDYLHPNSEGVPNPLQNAELKDPDLKAGVSPNLMQEPILTVSHLTTPLQIGQQIYSVVEDLSFSLYLGKTLALVGESGCGKSMTALSIMRILPKPPCLPPKGEVIYRGQNLLKLSEKEMRTLRGGKIAMIFQDPTTALNPVFTVGDQLMEVAALHLGLYGEDAEERALNVLREVRVSSPAERFFNYPHELSGGMKQRVMIAMALMCEPDILIADEPTTALDVTVQAQVLELIKELQARKGMALLLITHDMGIVAEMADDVIVMYASQAVERGSVLEIFEEMSHPYTRGLFKSRPTLETSRGKLQPIKGTVPPLTKYPTGCRFHPRCPYIMPKCKSGEVPDFDVPDSIPEHTTKCWLHDQTEESIRRFQEIGP
ncbi:MAG TPA: ABC transporter ATP-binding protein [Waddliaceae bacterium]